MALMDCVCKRCLARLRARAGGRIIYVPKRDRIDKAKLLRLHAAGKTANQLSSLLGITPRRVYQVLAESKGGKV